MPKTPGFASQAQRAKWGELVKSGKVSQQQYDQRERDSASSLPPSAGTPKTPRSTVYDRAMKRQIY